MIETLEYRIAELERLFARLLRIGEVVETDYIKQRVRVQIGDLRSAWIPWATAKTTGATDDSHKPEIGEQMLIVAPFGDLTQAVAVAALYSDTHPSQTIDSTISRVTHADGAAIEYNRTTHHLSASLPVGATAALVADGGIAVTGTITVIGDVIADGISLKQHVHGGILPGGANTGAPQ